jgi:hypothetical protein
MYVSKDIIINIDKLIESGLLIDSYFLLHCIHNSKKELLELYVDKCGKISKPAIDQLQSKGYIEDIIDNITFSKIIPTSKTLKLLGSNNLDHDTLFKELREAYHKKTPSGRPLQTNIDVCKKRYKSIVDSEETHKTIIKCVNLHFNNLRINNKLEFAQALPAWLNQKNYEVYWEEAMLNSEIGEEEEYGAI